MIPTSYLRQVPVRYEFEFAHCGGVATKSTTTGYRLQQWWTLDYSASESYIDMADGKQYPGEWRDVEISQETV